VSKHVPKAMAVEEAGGNVSEWHQMIVIGSRRRLVACTSGSKEGG
jgi:hypothetical protein